MWTKEWALAEPPIAPARGGGSKRTIDARKVANGLMDVPSARWSDGKVTNHPCSYGVGSSHNQSAETSHGR